MKPDSPHYSHCVAILRQFPLFAQLSETELRDMMQMFRYERKEKHEIAVSSKEAFNQFYLIISGHAKVSAFHLETGREHILYLIGPGDGFDLISLLEGERHDAVATALEDMEVLSASVQQTRNWIARHPDFNRAFLPYLGQQMHALAEQISDLSLYDTEIRLARLILRQVTEKSPAGGLRLINDLSQEALAAMIGSVRVVVTRHFQHWKNDKVIEGSRGHWSKIDVEALRDKAEQ